MALPLSYNVRNLRVRWRVTMLAVGGIGLVVAVMVVLLAMAHGFRRTLRATGRTDNAVIVQRGSASELSSWVPLGQRDLLVVDDRVARAADGQPLASPEVVVVASMRRRADARLTNVTVRGVTPRAFQVRGGLRITRGRPFRPGLREVLVGERIAERIRDLDVGGTAVIQRSEWQVVGAFESSGGAFESEVWGDFDVMAAAFQRPGGSNSLVVRVNDPGAIRGFDQEVRKNPQMQLRVEQELQYYEKQSSAVTGPLLVLAIFVGVVMGIGAVFGAMNTMYAIVSSRTREIGALRALGFTRRAILLAFVIESVLVAVMGGALGCLMALPVNAFSGATGSTAGYAEVAWAFRVSPGAVGACLAAAMVMGLLGGLLPALRAARLPIAAALRGK